MSHPSTSWLKDRDPSAFWNGVSASRLPMFNGVSHFACASAEDTLKRLAQEERAMWRAVRRVLRAIRAQHNSAIPMSRLPPEIMTRIFSFHDAVEREHRQEQDAPEIPGNVKVSHVCRRWRQIALGCSSLWTTIDFAETGPPPQVLLERSKTMPLLFEINHNACIDHNAIKLIVKNIHRTRILRLPGDENQSWGELLGSLDPSAPLLETFEVDDLDASEYFPFPKRLFERHTPRLRHLRWKSPTPMLWTSPLLKNLETLYVKLNWPPDAPLKPRPSLEHVLDALRAMPNLRSLTLRDDLPLPLRGTRDLSSVVELPRLAHLVLSCPVAATGQIFRCLSIPRTAETYLSGNCNGEPVADFHRFFDDLSVGLARSNFSASMFRVTLPCSGFLKVMAWHTLNQESLAAATDLDYADCDEKSTAFNGDINISLEWGDGERARPRLPPCDIARGFYGVFASQHLQEAVISVPGWSVDAWLDAFELSPELRTIVAGGEAGITLFDAFERTEGASDGTARLTRLESIALCIGKYGGMPGKESRPFRKFLDKLVPSVERRARAGCPLEDVFVTEYHHPSVVWADALREAAAGTVIHVGRRAWDGSHYGLVA